MLSSGMSGRSLQAFWRNIWPTPSGSKTDPSKSIPHCSWSICKHSKQKAGLPVNLATALYNKLEGM
jgi:hypothetical protein